MHDELHRDRGAKPSRFLYALGSDAGADQERRLMETAAYLAGEPGTDRPASVHPTLGSVARCVDDHSSPEVRPDLLCLAPALLGTAKVGLEIPARLVATCVSTVLASPERKRIAADELRRLSAARRTALFLLERSCGGHGVNAARADSDCTPRASSRMWLQVLDGVNLTESVYRRVVSPEVVAEAVAVAARASGEERDARLAQLLRLCTGLTRQLVTGGHDGEDGPSVAGDV